MKLYYSPGACSLAPHIILREAGAEFALEKVDIRAKTTETGADFNDINPRGYVPVLELSDGYKLAEGIVIHQYIADGAPNANLAPARGTRERLQLEEQLAFLSTELHKAFSPLFSPTTPADYRPMVIDKIGQRFDLIEQRLADGRPYLMGQDFTIADAYLFTLANWTKFVGIDLARWPHLSAFQARVTARPAVQEALKAEGLLAA